MCSGIFYSSSQRIGVKTALTLAGRSCRTSFRNVSAPNESARYQNDSSRRSISLQGPCDQSSLSSRTSVGISIVVILYLSQDDRVSHRARAIPDHEPKNVDNL